MTNKHRLTEVKIQKPVILESEMTDSPNKQKTFKLPLIECDVEGLNKRIYPRNEIERQLQEIEYKVKNKQLLGELDHPVGDERSGLVYIKEQSHVIEEINTDQNGTVTGKFRIIDSPNGRILNSVLESDVQIGQSLRQQGDLQPNGRGQFLVSDLSIITWDIVQNPSYEITFFNKESLKENVQYYLNNNKYLLESDNKNNESYLNELAKEIGIKFYENYVRTNVLKSNKKINENKIIKIITDNINSIVNEVKEVKPNS